MPNYRLFVADRIATECIKQNVLSYKFGTTIDLSVEAVGKAVSALAVGNFPYSTGQVIMIDGGITLSRF